MSVENRANVQLNEQLWMGYPGNEYKKITLDKDNVRENTDGFTTREFIEKVAWKHVDSKLRDIVLKSTASFVDAGASLAANLITDVDFLLPGPPDDSVIGKTESSSERIRGN